MTQEINRTIYSNVTVKALGDNVFMATTSALHMGNLTPLLFV